MEKKYKTMVKDVYFGKQGNSWRFFNRDEDGTDHVVGNIYPNKDCLLADMYRYLKENWGYST